MSVYVDFLKRDDLQITTSDKTFRDLEKEFLKKYKDRAIIGFFKYKPYPFDLTVVTIKDGLDTDSKYLIITDKTKFTNEVFKTKLKEISEAINIDETSIIKLMNHESGLDPSIKNSIGCVGLIQFCPSSGGTKKINGKSYSLEDLRYDLEAQMDAIKQFWLTGYNSGKIKSAEDLYIYNFFFHN